MTIVFLNIIKRKSRLMRLRETNKELPTARKTNHEKDKQSQRILKRPMKSHLKRIKENLLFRSLKKGQYKERKRF